MQLFMGLECGDRDPHDPKVEDRYEYFPSTDEPPSDPEHGNPGNAREHHWPASGFGESRNHAVPEPVSSASDPFSLVGWLFSINFELEQIMAAVVQSNAAGVQSRAVQFSCDFEDKTPQAGPPIKGNSIG